MEHKNVAVDKKGGIGFLILNRPPVNNALNQELLTDISQTLEEFDRDREVRLIIVKGAGKNFCTGVDLAQIVCLDEEGSGNFFHDLNEMYKTF